MYNFPFFNCHIKDFSYSWRFLARKEIANLVKYSLIIEGIQGFFAADLLL